MGKYRRAKKAYAEKEEKAVTSSMVRIPHRKDCQRHPDGYRTFKVGGIGYQVEECVCRQLSWGNVASLVRVLELETGIRLYSEKELYAMLSESGRIFDSERLFQQIPAAYSNHPVYYYYLKDVLRSRKFPKKYCRKCGVRMKKELVGNWWEYSHSERHSITYFVQSVGGGLIKIGKTGNSMESRLKGLQASSPIELKCLALLPFDMEGVLHAYFAPHREHGEWFEPVSCLVGMIEEINKEDKTEKFFEELLYRCCCEPFLDD